MIHRITPCLWFDYEAPDAEKSQRAMRAMLGMKKLDLAAIWRAYDGQGPT